MPLCPLSVYMDRVMKEIQVRVQDEKIPLMGEKESLHMIT